MNMNYKVWFNDEVFFPRMTRSCLWMLLIQILLNNVIILCFKVLSWNPVSGVEGWILQVFYWKAAFYHIALSLTAVTYATVHVQYYSVERHICSTRFEKICYSFNLCHLQHVVKLSALGGLYSYCWLGLIGSSIFKEKTLLESFFAIGDKDGLSVLFVVAHGFYTGMIFSLKYFICDLYLVRFSLIQETRVQSVNRQVLALLKENFLGVLKVIHWHYIFFIITVSVPFLKEMLTSNFSITLSSNTSLFFNLLNIPLFLTALTSGAILCFSWNLFIVIFNTFAIERYKFVIEAPPKGEKTKLLFTALKSEDFPLMQYLAILDLRLLSQYDTDRRQRFFTISNPGGHPHCWNALSEICISYLQDFYTKLNQFSITAASEKPEFIQQSAMSPLVLQKKNLILPSESKYSSPLDKILIYLRERPLIAYFLDEIPNAKIMKLFASSQPIVWIIEAVGFFLSASYTEDKYGVAQRHMAEIIRLLLDLKMAEEKLPIGMVGIQSNVKDSQGRYDHLHQRFSVKCAVNFSLKKISMTFKEDISGIYLPEQYKRYFQRYMKQKNI